MKAPTPQLKIIHDQNGPRVVYGETGDLVHGVRSVRYEASAKSERAMLGKVVIELTPRECHVDVDTLQGTKRTGIDWTLQVPGEAVPRTIECVTFRDGTEWIPPL